MIDKRFINIDIGGEVNLQGNGKWHNNNEIV